MIVRVECPQCKQVSEVPFKRAFSILIDNEYIGSGEYVAGVDNVYYCCSGCKAETPIEWE